MHNCWIQRCADGSQRRPHRKQPLTMSRNLEPLQRKHGLIPSYGVALRLAHLTVSAATCFFSLSGQQKRRSGSSDREGRFVFLRLVHDYRRCARGISDMPQLYGSLWLSPAEKSWSTGSSTTEKPQKCRGAAEVIFCSCFWTDSR